MEETLASRRRGPSPQSLAFFFGTARSRSESAAVVGLCYLLGVLPSEPVANPRRELPSVWRGQKLCVAYEMYLELVPQTVMTLEHVVLLIMTVALGHEFQVGHCISCGGVIVIDRSSLGDGAAPTAETMSIDDWKQRQSGALIQRKRNRSSRICSACRVSVTGSESGDSTELAKRQGPPKFRS
jgi:hypothetical protein